MIIHHWLTQHVMGGGRSLCRLGGVVPATCGQHGRCCDLRILACMWDVHSFRGCTAHCGDCSEGGSAVTWGSLDCWHMVVCKPFAEANGPSLRPRGVQASALPDGCRCIFEGKVWRVMPIKVASPAFGGGMPCECRRVACTGGGSHALCLCALVVRAAPAGERLLLCQVRDATIAFLEIWLC